MVASIGAQVALIAFAVAIAAGLHAGNSAMTILARALLVMGGALLVAQLAALCSKVILRDHLQRSKASIDRAHVEGASEREAASPMPR